MSSYSGVNSEHRTLLNDCIVKWIDFVIAFDIELNSDTESIALTSIEKHLCLNFIRFAYQSTEVIDTKACRIHLPVLFAVCVCVRAKSDPEVRHHISFIRVVPVH